MADEIVPPRPGTVDMLLGLFAALSNELRFRSKGQRSSISPQRVFQGLQGLQQRPEYASDWTHLSEESFSLMFFQMCALGLARLEEEGKAVTVDEDRANRRLALLKKQYGSATVEKILQMAQDLLDLPPA